MNCIQQEIYSAKQLRRILCDTDTNQNKVEYLREMLERHMTKIKFYRQQDQVKSYWVKGLYESDVYFDSLDDLHYWLEDADLDIGCQVSIEIVLLSGRELGRLPLLEV